MSDRALAPRAPVVRYVVSIAFFLHASDLVPLDRHLSPSLVTGERNIVLPRLRFDCVEVPRVFFSTTSNPAFERKEERRKATTACTADWSLAPPKGRGVKSKRREPSPSEGSAGHHQKRRRTTIFSAISDSYNRANRQLAACDALD